MKKFIVTVITVGCLALTLQAQTINKTYYDKDRRLEPLSTALLQEAGKERIFTSMRTTETNGDQKLMITKTDENGNFIKAILQDHCLEIHRIISTSDNCLLLVAPMVATPGGVLSSANLMVMKLDVNLNVIWSRIYPAAPHANSTIVHSNIDVAKYTRGGVESYYIYYSGQGPLSGDETSFAIAKINGTGALAWHKVYADPAHTGGGVLRDMAGGITVFNRGANPEFAVVGKRENWDIGSTHRLFYMNINESGNITSPYQWVNTGGSRPESPDITWDGTDLISTYIELNSGIVVNPNNASGIGFIKSDINYSAFSGRYYWQTCENYGRSITVAPDGNYVMGGLASRCSPTQPAGDYGYTPYFLKINRTTFNPIAFRRYNKLEQVRVWGAHIANGTGDNYITGEVPSTCIGCPQGYRLIKTDPALNACGAEPFPITTVTTAPGAIAIPYTPFSFGGSMPYGITSTVVTLPEQMCTQAFNRALGMNDITEEEASGIVIAPNLLRSSTEQVTCTVDGTLGKTAEITVYNLLGQLLYSKKHALSSGSNTINVPATFSTGMNMLRVAVDGTVLKTAKVELIK